MSARHPDIIILDFDGCLYPGISKVRVAIDITLNLAIRPYQPADRRLLPHMGLSAMILILTRLQQRIGNRITDGDLVKRYQRHLGSLTLSYFEAASQRIVGSLYPGAIETLAFLCRVGNCGVISLALNPVLAALNTRLRSEHDCSLAFYHGNSISSFRAKMSDRPVLNGQDKRDFMIAEIENRGCKTPLIIGNDLEDVPMAVLAKEMGGMSIGFNPRKSARAHFDIAVYGRNWYRLSSIVREHI